MHSVDAVELALASFRDPWAHKLRFASSAPLPPGMDRLLVLAGGTPSLLGEAAREANVKPDELRQAACFLIQQLCFVPHATHYRVLGLEPGAATDQINNHYNCLRSIYHRDRGAPEAAIGLQVLLYPLCLFPADRGDSGAWSDAYEARINRAHSVLSSPSLRARYDALLQRSELLASTAALSEPQTKAANGSRVLTPISNPSLTPSTSGSPVESVQPLTRQRPIPIVQVAIPTDDSRLSKDRLRGDAAPGVSHSWMSRLPGHRTGLLWILFGLALLIGLVILVRLSLVPDGETSGTDLVSTTDQDDSHTSSEESMRLDSSHALDLQPAIPGKLEIIQSSESPTATGAESTGAGLAPVASEVATPTPSLPSDNVSPLTHSSAVVSTPSLDRIEEAGVPSGEQPAVDRIGPSGVSPEPSVNRTLADSDKPSVIDTTPQSSIPSGPALTTGDSPESPVPSATRPVMPDKALTRVSEVPTSTGFDPDEVAASTPTRRDRLGRAHSQTNGPGPRVNVEQRRATASKTPARLVHSTRPTPSYRRGSPKTDWKRVVGQWYETGYLKRLQATRSPCQAIVEGEIPRVTLRQDEGYLSADIDYGFHEQVSVRLAKTGEMGGTKVVRSKVSGQGRHPFIEKLAWHGGESPSVTLIREQSKGKRTVFSYRPLSLTELNRVVIAGVYRGWSHDREGAVTITPEGKFTGPSMDFSFELGLDCSFANCDYLQANDGTRERDGSPLRYGVLRTKGGLALFKVRNKGDGQFVCETKPLYVLDGSW